MDLKNKKVLFLGDSITQGIGTSDEAHIYLNLIKEQWGLRAAVNYGVSGSRIARQPGETEFQWGEEDYCMRMERMEQDADLVVVFGGTNDYGHGMAPLGGWNDRTPDTFYGACHYLMQGLMTKYPDVPIVFLSPLHRLNEENPRGSEKPYDFAPLSEYVRILRRCTTYYSLPVLDLFANSGIQPAVDANRERFMPDGLHPSDAGHAKIASLLGNFLSQL